MVLDQNTLMMLALVGLCALLAGSIAYFFMFRQIETDNRTSRRLEKLGDRSGGVGAGRKKAAQSRVADASKRRKSVESSLHELEEAQKKKAKRSNKPTMRALLKQAGLPITVAQFYMISAVLGVAATGAAIVMLQQPPLLAVGAGISAGIGLPRFIVNYMRKKRFKAFAAEFPNAVDVLVRGVKSGLPVNDCFRIIANEAAEPVASEFRTIIEGQNVGLTIPQSVQRMYERVPLSETNFFAIVITIQQSAGGNLSEALGNLSGVLRDRKKMQAKIKAMSSEAVASGAIIGALPVAVSGMLFLVSPDYIGLMFSHPTGHQNLMIMAFWMSCGIFAMRKMINFDF
jgi:tight adherence protein B